MEKRRYMYDSLHLVLILDIHTHCIKQTTFESGNVQLTTHRLTWDDEDQEVSKCFTKSG